MNFSKRKDVQGKAAFLSLSLAAAGENAALQAITTTVNLRSIPAEAARQAGSLLHFLPKR